MREIKITIKTTNDAFCDGNAEREVARIIYNLSGHLMNGEKKEILMDINGNKVGKVEYK